MRSVEGRLALLCEAAANCRLCPRMATRTKVLSAANGDPHSRVLFVAEAPGRLGADRTAVPLCGDASGRLFEELLSGAGWRRDEVFITNALLCNPRSEKGNNDRPSGEELTNCSAYLQATLDLVDPDVVVALGGVALSALELIAPHGLSLRDDAAELHPWHGRQLVPLYHPAPRARVHRSPIHQRADFADLATYVDPKRGLKQRRPRTKPPELSHGSPLERLMVAVVSLLGSTSYFRLTKLLYFADLRATTQLGRSLTGQLYLRAQEGPWSPGLRDALARLRGHEVVCSGRGPSLTLRPGPQPRFAAELDEQALEILAEVLARYSARSEAELKTAAYLTPPMREMLVREQRGERTRGQPLQLDANRD